MTTKAKMLFERIQTTKKRLENLQEQEIQDLKYILETCCGGDWEFDVEGGTTPYCSGYAKKIDEPVDYRVESVKIGEDGELEIYGPYLIGDEPYEYGKIEPHKLFPGQIQIITDLIYYSWADIQGE